MARKKLRTENLQVRLTVEEKDALELEARLSGMGLSDFIRQIIYYQREKRSLSHITDPQEREIQHYIQRTQKNGISTGYQEQW